MTYLELRGITRLYPGGVTANDGIDLRVERGEIHGLVGENGAGKSTLMKILYGMEQPDSGTILIDGQPVTLPNPQAAIRHGIGMVHQHFQLVPSLSVAENVALGGETRAGLFADRSSMIARVAALAVRYGLQVDPTARVGDLSVGLQQRVEILKMLYRDARLLILDEPSAVLTPQEVDSLFDVLRRLIAGGCTAIFITHKLYEITSLCARATVLRRGRVVGTVDVPSSSPAEIARLMVGHEIDDTLERAPTAVQLERLILRGVSADDMNGRRTLREVDLVVRGGEIVGIAGVEGNGQRELVEALLGVRPVSGGEISLDGRPINSLSIRQRRGEGIALIPEDRNREGLSREMTIWENLAAGTYHRPPASRYGWLNLNGLRAAARTQIAQFDIRASGENAAVKSLSGGNAQKVVIARELAHPPALLIAAQPTRGLDIGAARFVHEQLLALRAAGTAILLISADLDEVLTVSDRIAVLFNGRLSAAQTREAVTREQIGLAMAGKSSEVTA